MKATDYLWHSIGPAENWWRCPTENHGHNWCIILSRQQTYLRHAEVTRANGSTRTPLTGRRRSMLFQWFVFGLTRAVTVDREFSILIPFDQKLSERWATTF